MPLHDLQLVTGLLFTSTAQDILVTEASLPPIDVLGDDFGAVFVDAGSRSDSLGLGVFVVKLAVLARLHRGLRVEEKIYHPIPVKDKGGSFLPIIIGKGSERVKQAAVYVVELASLLEILRDPGRVFPEPIEKLLLVRHGPLLQMLSQYLSKPFVVDTLTALNLLLYAGMEKGEAYELLENAYMCKPGGDLDRNRVVLGLLALTLLSELIREARGRKAGLAGIVEDVSRSRSLVASAVAILFKRILSGKKQEVFTEAEIAEQLRAGTYKYWSRNASALERCLCPGIDTKRVLDSREEWEELVTSTRRVLSTRFKSSLEEALSHTSLLEAALLWSGVLPDMNDSDLLYLLYYLLGANYYPGTVPFPNTARLIILRYYMERDKELECHGEKIEEYMRNLGSLRYQYFAPVKPPSCKDLERSLEQKSLQNTLRPCDLADLYTVPPAIRLEYINGMNLLDHARAFTIYPARIVYYGYPPQLLVVDKYSRVSLPETVSLMEIGEVLAKRLRLYTSFIRGWETRVASSV